MSPSNTLLLMCPVQPEIVPIHFSPSKVQPFFSHAAYWDGKKKKMTQVHALQEVCNWLWKVFAEMNPDESMDGKPTGFS